MEKKKRFDQKALAIAKEVKMEIWEGNVETYWDEMEQQRDLEEKSCNHLMLQLVEMCLSEDFPIEEYHLYDIPYSNKDGVMYCFVHSKDKKIFNRSKNPKQKIRGIDFFSKYDGTVIPIKLIYEKRKGFVQYETRTCFEAVSREM